MGVTEGDLQVYSCSRNPGKLYNTFCYTYLTKDQPPPSNLVVYSTVQCSTIEIMIRYYKWYIYISKHA